MSGSIVTNTEKVSASNFFINQEKRFVDADDSRTLLIIKIIYFSINNTYISL